MNVIGIAIDHKPTGDDGSHCIGCRTAMLKKRRIHHIIISKQQPKYYDESNPRPVLVMIDSLNTDSNHIYHRLTLLGAHHVFHVRVLRVKSVYRKVGE